MAQLIFARSVRSSSVDPDERVEGFADGAGLVGVASERARPVGRDEGPAVHWDRRARVEAKGAEGGGDGRRADASVYCRFLWSGADQPTRAHVPTAGEKGARDDSWCPVHITPRYIC